MAIFGPGINCIFGDNGNGKTNLLEAIYYLIYHRSFRRKAGFPQILGMDGGKPEILFSAVVQEAGKTEKGPSRPAQNFAYTGKVTAQGPLWFWQQKPAPKRPNIPLVLINPFDAHHFFFTASFRRGWFDQRLALLSQVYKQKWAYYQKALKQRNALLANAGGSSLPDGPLQALTDVMAASTAELLPLRLAFIQDLVKQTKQVFPRLFQEDLALQLEMVSPFLNCSLQQIKDLYLEKLPAEKLAKRSLRGLHRDDYRIFIGDFQAEEYASMGQQKCAYLALEFAYIELFRYKFNAYPIVLMDDVSGELDQARWFNLVTYLRQCNFQVLITTANEKFRETLQQIGQINELKITSGEIKNLTSLGEEYREQIEKTE
ncbi:MAG: DNA replication and repair protein RecF [Bacteriovoracaceae bacterium]|nr:DNA replication and repair protein RecF [Bacteriovoracaceae bacterium]